MYVYVCVSSYKCTCICSSVPVKWVKMKIDVYTKVKKAKSMGGGSWTERKVRGGETIEGRSKIVSEAGVTRLQAGETGR